MYNYRTLKQLLPRDKLLVWIEENTPGNTSHYVWPLTPKVALTNIIKVEPTKKKL